MTDSEARPAGPRTSKSYRRHMLDGGGSAGATGPLRFAPRRPRAARNERERADQLAAPQVARLAGHPDVGLSGARTPAAGPAGRVSTEANAAGGDIGDGG